MGNKRVSFPLFFSQCSFKKRKRFIQVHETKQAKAENRFKALSTFPED